MDDVGNKEGMSRRDFLKSAGVFGGKVMADKVLGPLERPKSPEQLRPIEIKAIALKIGRSDPHEAMRALKQLFSMERCDVVVTPEFTFHYSLEKDEQGYRKVTVLYVNRAGAGYNISEYSDPLVISVIENARLLAAKNGSHIFLSSFYEMDERDPHNKEKYKNTMLHIDDHGNIIGVKRKFEAPEGNFSVDINGKAVKVLPLICGEAWEERIQDPISGKRRSLAPEWVRRGAPYHVLIHSLAQGDLKFEELQDHVDGDFVASDKKLPESWYVDTFKDYYSPYFPYLIKGASVVASDIGTAGIFESNMRPIKTWKDGDFYVSAIVKVG